MANSSRLGSPQNVPYILFVGAVVMWSSIALLGADKIKVLRPRWTSAVETSRFTADRSLEFKEEAHASRGMDSPSDFLKALNATILYSGLIAQQAFGSTHKDWSEVSKPLERFWYKGVEGNQTFQGNNQFIERPRTPSSMQVNGRWFLWHSTELRNGNCTCVTIKEEGDASFETFISQTLQCQAYNWHPPREGRQSDNIDDTGSNEDEKPLGKDILTSKLHSEAEGDLANGHSIDYLLIDCGGCEWTLSSKQSFRILLRRAQQMAITLNMEQGGKLTSRELVDMATALESSGLRIWRLDAKQTIPATSAIVVTVHLVRSPLAVHAHV